MLFAQSASLALITDDEVKAWVRTDLFRALGHKDKPEGRIQFVWFDVYGSRFERMVFGKGAYVSTIGMEWRRDRSDAVIVAFQPIPMDAGVLPRSFECRLVRIDGRIHGTCNSGRSFAE